jgi:hypothetical protein
MSASDPVILPLVAQSCALEPTELAEQLERYRELGRHTVRLQHQPRRLVAQFSDDLPAGLLEQTLEIERACCSFLSIDYDEPNRRLTVTTDAKDHDATLAALFSALGEEQVPVVEDALPDRQQPASSDPEPDQCCEPAGLESCCESEAKDACCERTAGGPPSSCGCQS